MLHIFYLIRPVLVDVFVVAVIFISLFDTFSRFYVLKFLMVTFVQCELLDPVQAKSHIPEPGLISPHSDWR